MKKIFFYFRFEFFNKLLFLNLPFKTKFTGLILMFLVNLSFGQNNTGEVPKDYKAPMPPDSSKVIENKIEENTINPSATVAFTTTVTYNFTGAMQTFVVPNGVNQIYVSMAGAQGGGGNIGGGSGSIGGAGGKGTLVEGYVNVTAGQILNIFVGGAGGAGVAGFNGGGTAGTSNSGGGGGATDIRFPGTAAADRKVVAGGGGGGGRAGCETTGVVGGAGGNGDSNGANGSNATTTNGQAGGGTGAIGQNFGVKGIGCASFLGTDGTAGNANGQGGSGGNGQSCCCFNFPSIPGGGGGGGGYVGGGGGGGGSAGTVSCTGQDKGAGGGGAGGTSLTTNMISPLLTNGFKTGNGQLTISYDLSVEVDSLAITQPTCTTVSAVNVLASIVVNGSLDATDASQTGRLNRFAIATTCAIPTTFPGTFTTTGARKYDIYSFQNTTGSSQCFETRLLTSGVNQYYVAYLNSFNPASLGTNYLGDPGSSGTNTKMSVTVPAGNTLLLVVHELNVGGGLGAYTLRVRNASLFSYSANGGSFADPSLFSALPSGNNSFVAQIGGTSILSSSKVGSIRFVESHTSDINITTNYPNNFLFKHTTTKITASNKIFSPSNIFYKAGQSISLNPGFEAVSGSKFNAAIGGCVD